jgi:hypothetical protein
MNTYNATNFSVCRITTDFELYFELTQNIYTQDPEFAERWNEYLVEMVSDRIWKYSDVIMQTALGDEIYEDRIDIEGDEECGVNTLRDAMLHFAKTQEEPLTYCVATGIWVPIEEEEEEEEEEDPLLTYKCRVECPDDITRVTDKSKQMLRDGYVFTTTSIVPQTIEGRDGKKYELPDRTWTFTSKARLPVVKDMFKMVTDAHVGEETVRLEADFTGERDYGNL